jgi:hypothetical protein
VPTRRSHSIAAGSPIDLIKLGPRSGYAEVCERGTVKNDSIDLQKVIAEGLLIFSTHCPVLLADRSEIA